MRIYQGGPMRGLPQYNFNAFEEGFAYLEWLGHEVVSPHDLDLDARDFYWRGDWQNSNCPPSYPIVRIRNFWEVWQSGSFSMEKAMRRDLAEIVECDAVSFLSGWTRSEGCRFEYGVARACGLPIYCHEPWKFFTST